MAVLSLSCCEGFSLVPESLSYCLAVLRELLITAAFLVVELGRGASLIAACGLSSFGALA